MDQIPAADAPCPPECRRFPTAHDVARLAGVSAATVSRVLNGTAGVRADKRAAVRKAAASLGFVANGAARALSLRRFMAVGAVVPNIENEGFVQALARFQARIRQAGYTLVVTNAGYGLERELAEATFLLERGIDGLMLVGDRHHASLLDRIARQAVPTVQTFTLSDTRACVGFDNFAAMARATTYLLDLGHRNFAVITGIRRDNDRSSARVAGIEATLAARALAIRPDHDVQVSHGIRDGRDALRHILSADGAPPTAVLCGTDQLAFGAMIEAAARGIDIPGDLSVVGFNDADYAAFLRPALTTVRMRSAEIGAAAAEHLLARMAGRAAMRVVELDAELIIRGSTAPPRGRPRVGR